MSEPVVAGLVELLGTNLAAEVWDGETPRFDTKGNPINPESVTVPSTWPGMAVFMDKGGVKRRRMFGGQYIDLVPMNINVWGTARGQEERMTRLVDVLLQRADSWDQMTATMKNLDKYVVRVVHARVDDWSSTQEQETRTAKSRLLYLGDIKVEVRVHGAMLIYPSADLPLGPQL